MSEVGEGVTVGGSVKREEGGDGEKVPVDEKTQPSPEAAARSIEKPLSNEEEEEGMREGGGVGTEESAKNEGDKNCVQWNPLIYIDSHDEKYP